jgi:hypothetical protein
MSGYPGFEGADGKKRTGTNDTRLTLAEDTRRCSSRGSQIARLANSWIVKTLRSTELADQIACPATR